MKSVKAIITDLDDTLLSPSKTISDEGIALLNKVKEKGIPFTFITGRPKYAVERFAEQVGIEYPIVCCNGALMFKGDKVLLKHSFGVKQVRGLMESANELGLTVLYYCNDIEYAMRRTTWVKVRQDAGRNFPVKIIAEDEWETLEVEKINIMSDGNAEAFAKLIPQIEDIREDLSIALYGHNGCEIVAKDINKAVGMRELAKQFNIKEEEIMAIGDNANDHEMLLGAGIGVAVGNAKEETKKCADYICENTYTEGVLEAIKKFVLKEEE